MRFRATITNPDPLQHLVSAAGKIACKKPVTLVLTSSQVHVVVNPTIGESVQLYSSLSTEMFMSRVRIESLCNNEIGLEVDAKLMCKALRTCSGSTDGVLKLSKVDEQPVLTFVVQSPFSSTRVKQNVPVQVVPSRQLARIREPVLKDNPEVQLLMPALGPMRTVVERMRTLADKVTIEADMGGHLSVSVATDMLDIRTTYGDLDLPELAKGPQLDRDEDISASVTLNATDLAQCLHCTVLQPQDVVICLAKDVVVIHVLLEGVFCTFFLHGKDEMDVDSE